ncbi:MAG: hypothetical protein BroJett014_04830 [Planctomycetota bacterium]|nr:MAG: hypothetical protein BroJett014_04830 [Planctomycetota bacterium]
MALIEDEAEQQTLTRIEALVDDGFSQRQIVEKLNRANTPTKFGGPWTRSSLRSVLKTHKRRLQLA